jgi:RNA polymerase sigma factor (sigma-70 family)
MEAKSIEHLRSLEPNSVYPAKAVDPIEIAHQALGKLRAARLSTIIRPEEVDITAMDMEGPAQLQPKNIAADAPGPLQRSPTKRTLVRKRKKEATPLHKLMDTPFFDIEAAKIEEPDIFSFEYDTSKSEDSKPNEHRKALRRMNGFFRDDSGILLRLENVYGITPEGHQASVTEDGLGDFLKKTARFRLLSKEDEFELFTKLHWGVAAFMKMEQAEDRDNALLLRIAREGSLAYQAIFHTNLRLVIRESHAVSGMWPHMETRDILTHSYIGIQKAIEKFDEKKGYKFSTYATNWFRQERRRGTSEEGRIIRIPVHANEDFLKLERVRRAVRQSKGHEPTLEEETELTGFSQDKIADIRNLYGTNMPSLDEKIKDGSDATIGDLFVSDESPLDRDMDKIFAAESLKRLLFNTDEQESAMDRLSDRDKFILSLRYGVRLDEMKGKQIKITPYDFVDYDTAMERLDRGTLKQTLTAIGDLLGLSRERINQIEEEALKKIANANPNFELV